MFRKVPLTSNSAVRETEPAILEAMQVYSPACFARTASMVNCFPRFPESDTIISSPELSMGLFWNIHLISIGKSPFVTMHKTDATSPAFTGSLPKVKAPICGATSVKNKKFSESVQPNL